jgi:hypothetical protein
MHWHTRLCRLLIEDPLLVVKWLTMADKQFVTLIKGSQILLMKPFLIQR